MRATLEGARANLEALWNECEQADNVYQQALAAEDAAWEAFTSAAIQAAVGLGSDCIDGLRQPVKGNWRAQLGQRVLNCLKSAAKGGGASVEEASAAFDEWLDARSAPEEALKQREDLLKRHADQEVAVANLEGQVQQSGC